MSSAEALEAIRSGRMSAERYVTAALDRADRVRPLNAFIAIDRADAVAQARRVDAQRAAGAALAPLAGLPIVVKDNINTREPADHRRHAGARRRAADAPTAPALQRWSTPARWSSARSNLHELAFGITSTNLDDARRAGAQPLRSDSHPGRLVGRHGGGDRRAHRAGGPRHRYRRLHAHAGGAVRHVGLRPSVGNGGAERRYDDAGPSCRSATRATPSGRWRRTVADIALLDRVITGAAPSRGGRR